MTKPKPAFQFEKLFELYVSHQYYEDGRCYDFLIIPTCDSLEIMNDLGLHFTQRPGGFILAYDEGRKNALMNYIQSEKGHMPRLSFEMVMENSLFINFTDLPTKTNQLYESLYFCNRNAHKSKKKTLINTGEYVSGEELFDSKYGLIKVENPDRTKKYQVELIDISGNSVIIEPFCARIPSDVEKDRHISIKGFNTAKMRPKLIKSNKNKVTCKDDECFEREFIYIDLDSVPCGKYRIQITNMDDKPDLPEGPPFISHLADCTPLGFMDILFTDPDANGNSNDFYPIQHDGTVTPRSYSICFNMRSTIWKYFVVVPENRVNYHDLKIKGNGTTFTPLPLETVNGNKAWPFESTGSVALKEAPPYKFTLKGKKEGANSPVTIINRLPAASADQILPENRGETGKGGKTVYSDIYVYV